MRMHLQYMMYVYTCNAYFCRSGILIFHNRVYLSQKFTSTVPRHSQPYHLNPPAQTVAQTKPDRKKADYFKDLGR